MTEDNEARPPVVDEAGRRKRTAGLFVAIYFVGVAGVSLALGSDVRAALPLVAIAAVPALFAVALSLPVVIRNLRVVPLVVMYLVLLPALAALFIGGCGVLLAIGVSNFVAR